jgi:hypothetical protein
VSIEDKRVSRVRRDLPHQWDSRNGGAKAHACMMRGMAAA